MGGYAWVTLATNDSYSLGSLVLAHSLKKANTAHKLAILITPAVSQPMREQLQSAFDVVKLVDVLDSKDEAHLALMKRPELGVTFTKIHCWRLTEFDKCVFLDADTLVVRNCDELFDREEFSAAPDVSWPDCFNSGVFVYKPSNETFDKLLQFAVDHGSFDGGDQGLLNQFFSDWATEDIKKHLPFVYNLTSVAVYSYIPAFKQYGSETRIVHFIGTGKPWLQRLDPATRTITPSPGSEHLTPLLQKWWDIFCEKVHPSLNKGLEISVGNSHPPVVEAVCDSNPPIECPDVPETPCLIEPDTPYREKDDFRQCNLPYQPFEVKGSSGELLNVGFSFIADDSLESVTESNETRKTDHVESANSEPVDQVPDENTGSNIISYSAVEVNTNVESSSDSECIKNIPNNSEENESFDPPKNSYNFNYETVEDSLESNDANIADKETSKSELHEEIPVVSNSKIESKGQFHFDHFFPDDACVNTYLEQNLLKYKPFESHVTQSYNSQETTCTSDEVLLTNTEAAPKKQPFREDETPSLPRFLTLPEDDIRQSGNISAPCAINEQITIDEIPKPPSFTPPEAAKPKPIIIDAVMPEEKSENSVSTTSVSSLIREETKNPTPTLPKSKSMSQLFFDAISVEQYPTTSKWQASIPIESQRRFSMPKLKPLLPKNSVVYKSSPAIFPKVTMYTEFFMSSEYRDPVNLPVDKEGFVESQIRKDVHLKRSKSDACLGNKFGPLPRAEGEEKILMSFRFEADKPSKPFTDLYDLKSCKRQMGNKPKIVDSLPKEKSSTSLSRNEKESSYIRKKKKRATTEADTKENREKKMKEGKKVVKQDTQVKKPKIPSILPANKQGNSVEDILKKLIDFSKNYLHYFGDITRKSRICSQSVKDKNSYGTKNGEIQYKEAAVQTPKNLLRSSVSKKPEKTDVHSTERQKSYEFLKTESTVKNGLGPANESPTKTTPTKSFERFRTYLHDQCETAQKGLCGLQDVVKSVKSPGRRRHDINSVKSSANASSQTQGSFFENVGGDDDDDDGQNFKVHEKNDCRQLVVYSDFQRWKRKYEKFCRLNKTTGVATNKVIPLPWIDHTPSTSKSNQQALGFIKKYLPNTVTNGTSQGTISGENHISKLAPSKLKKTRSKRKKPDFSKNTHNDVPLSLRYDSPEEPVANGKPTKHSVTNHLPNSTTSNTIAKPLTTVAPVTTSLANAMITGTRNSFTKSTNKVDVPGKVVLGMDQSSGIAGAIAQLNLEAENGRDTLEGSQSLAHQEYLRRQNWETGNMDYMGRDSFDNIWSKICQTLEQKDPEIPMTGPGEVQKTPESDKKAKETTLTGLSNQTASPVTSTELKDSQKPKEQSKPTEAVPANQSSQQKISPSAPVSPTVPQVTAESKKELTGAIISAPVTPPISVISEIISTSLSSPAPTDVSPKPPITPCTETSSVSPLPQQSDSHLPKSESEAPVKPEPAKAKETSSKPTVEGSGACPIVTSPQSQIPQVPPVKDTCKKTETVLPETTAIPDVIPKNNVASSVAVTSPSAPEVKTPLPSSPQEVPAPGGPPDVPKIAQQLTSSDKNENNNKPVKNSEVLSTDHSEVAIIRTPPTPIEKTADDCGFPVNQVEVKEQKESKPQPLDTVKTEKKPTEEIKKGDTNERGTAVVPYCDVFESAKKAQAADTQISKESHRKNVEEAIKNQAQAKADQFPPIPMPESPTEVTPPVVHQVDQVPIVGKKEDSPKEEAKSKKGVISKILEIVGVSPKEKTETEAEVPKSTFYDVEGAATEANAEDKKKQEPQPSDKPGTKKEESGQQLAAVIAPVPPSESEKEKEQKKPESSASEANKSEKETSNENQKGGDKKNSRKNKGKSPKPPPLPEKKRDSKKTEPEKKPEAPSKESSQASQPRGNQKDKAKSKQDKQGNAQVKKDEPKSPEEASSVQQDVCKSKKKSPSPSLSITEPSDAVKVDNLKNIKNPALLTIDDSIPETPPAGGLKEGSGGTAASVEGKLKEEVDAIIDKAKTVVESQLETRKSAEKQVAKVADTSDGGEGVNALKLITDDGKPNQLNQAPAKSDAKPDHGKSKSQNEQKGKRGSQNQKQVPPSATATTPTTARPEEMEELKVTTEEERKKHKSETPTSKLSDQILKAIPPPRRKAISDAKTESASGTAPQGAAPKAPEETASAKPESQKPPEAAKSSGGGGGGGGGGGSASQKSKTVSDPVPPPRNRSKPRQKTPPKGKQKK